MSHPSPYAGKTLGVLGLGKSGAATVAFLVAAGAHIVMWDDNERGRDIPEAHLPNVHVLPSEQWDFSQLAAMVLSPGIPLTHPVPHPAVMAARASGCAVIGDIEVLYASQPSARYIGITGTNGKSTTTTLIGHILAHAGKVLQVGGNLGTAALSLKKLGPNGVYVLEMSSYQLDLIRQTRFNTAILTNISEDHIDRHGSLEGYIAAKLHVFDQQHSGDVAIIGADDPHCLAIIQKLRAQGNAKVIAISGAHEVAQGVFLKDGILVSRLGEQEQYIDLGGIKSLQGAHNGQNAAAAYAACWAEGIAHHTIEEAMQSFGGLAHRMQWLGEVAGVQYVNDSKATNADAAEKALLTYDHIYWIAGGVAKEGGIETLAPYFPKIRHAYLIGKATEMFAQTLEGHVAYTRCETLANAVAAATRDARAAGIKGAAIVLAPACASFDQYRNFEERGADFVAQYQALKEGA